MAKLIAELKQDKKTAENIGFVLADIGNATAEYLWPCRDSLHLETHASVLHLADLYAKFAKDYYSSDPVRYSCLLLTLLALASILDSLACRGIPNYSQHRLPITISWAHRLLIGSKNGMDLMASIEVYWHERNSGASKGSIWDISQDGMPYAYASTKLEAQRQRIVEKMNSDMDSKRVQVRVAIEKTRALQAILDDINAHSETCHLPLCGTCGNKKKYVGQIEIARSVPVYEKALPDDGVLSWVVVFFQHTPPLLQSTSDGFGLLIQAIAVKHRSIEEWWSKGTKLVSLGSTNKSFIYTHYKALNVLQATEDDFIVPSGRNCVVGFEPDGSQLVLDGTELNEKVGVLCTVVLSAPLCSLQV